MNMRKLFNTELPAVGIGCMNLSHAYGVPPKPEDAIRLLHHAFDLGVRHFDTAALYGFGANETLLGEALKDIRKDIFLASKCGMTGVDGVRVIDGQPKTIKATCEAALKRLNTDYIDLYYLHRFDKNVPIEDSVGAISRLVEEGKVGSIGLSEVSAETIKRAHSEHPIAAVQTEYSLWTRNAELGVIETCKELEVAFVAFSPLARGFLTGLVSSPDDFAEKDIRRGMPRFQEPNFSKNKTLLAPFSQLASEAGCSMGELALAWVLAQGEHIHIIPGTTSKGHLQQNIAAGDLVIPSEILDKAGYLINQKTIVGPRYPAGTQAEIDTEEFS